MSFLAALIPGLAGGGASAALGIGSGLVGLIGAGVQASGQKKAAEAQARADEFNAKALEQQAAAARDASNVEAADYRRQQGRAIAERRAAYGANGLTAAGSPLLVEDAMIREIALGSARQGYQGMINESRLQDQATLSRMSAANSREAGDMAAGATLLTGFGNLLGSWG